MIRRIYKGFLEFIVVVTVVEVHVRILNENDVELVYQRNWIELSVNHFAEAMMHILLVHIAVKTEYIEEFTQASFENSRESRKEEGVVRFDVLQQTEDPNRFTLLEVYRTPDDHRKHRETIHYQNWRDKVGVMMAEPRQGIRYINLYPDDASWVGK